MHEQQDPAAALRMRLERALQEMLNHLDLNTELLVEIIELAHDLSLPETEEKAQELIRHKRLYVMNEIPHKISPISMLETIDTVLQELLYLRTDLTSSMNGLFKDAEEWNNSLAHHITAIERSIASLSQKAESLTQRYTREMLEVNHKGQSAKQAIGKHTASILAEVDKQHTQCSNR